MELGDLEASDDGTGRGVFHLYVVRGRSTAKQRFVRSRKGAINRVSPNVVEEHLIAKFDTSEVNFIDSLGRERSGMVEDCRQ